MQQVKAYQKLIHEALGELRFDQKPEALYQPIAYILGLGGKRLRPLLVLLCGDIFETDPDKLLLPAIGLEVFHNFTLLHDDIMDKAPLRRGQPTVHEKWNANSAILSGDTMYVMAYQLMMQVDTAYLRPVLELFNTTAIQVCEGQQLDMNFETRNNVSIAEYLHMIELKTAVLLACCLKTGALLSNATAEEAGHLYEFGKNIGLAFQLQDDILDVYADATSFGKQVGGDIVSNKKTFLLLKALELSDAHTGESLRGWLKAPENAAVEKVAAVTEIYNLLNIKKLAEKEMDKFFHKGLSHLDKITPFRTKGHIGKQQLRDFAEALMERTL
jgi:geranylgeranyl diphosphate synthase type II